MEQEAVPRPGDPGPAGNPAPVAEAPNPAFPQDPRDGWEPGAPSLRAMAPSLVGGAAVPLLVYYSVRHEVGGDAAALAIAGVPAALWVGVEWIRRRRIDPIGAIILFGFVAGIAASYALGGSAFVLKVRDSAFTFLFGLACLASLRIGPRPVMFYVGRSLSAGDDPVRLAAYDDLWNDVVASRPVFRIITAVWGVGLMVEAGARVLLAMVLPTGEFLAVIPLVSAVFVGGMLTFTIWFSRWSRRRAEEAMEVPSPEGGGSALWWMRYWTGRRVEPPAVAGEKAGA